MKLSACLAVRRRWMAWMATQNYEVYGLCYMLTRYVQFRLNPVLSIVLFTLNILFSKFSFCARDTSSLYSQEL